MAKDRSADYSKLSFQVANLDRAAGRRNSPRVPPNSKTEKGPELLGEILSRLFTARGWGRRQDRIRLEKAWEEVVGPSTAAHTRIGNLRRGVLEIVVDNAVLMQELAHFQKRRLLQGLHRCLAGVSITDLRFRAGAWEKP